jgi:microcystin degradation protein MlrC
MQGINVDMGPCAVVRVEGVIILLTSRKTPSFDLGQLRSQGIEPTSLSVIGVKAAVAHRRAYDPIAVASYLGTNARAVLQRFAQSPLSSRAPPELSTR